MSITKIRTSHSRPTEAAVEDELVAEAAHMLEEAVVNRLDVEMTDNHLAAEVVVALLEVVEYYCLMLDVMDY